MILLQRTEKWAVGIVTELQGFLAGTFCQERGEVMERRTWIHAALCLRHAAGHCSCTLFSQRHTDSCCDAGGICLLGFLSNSSYSQLVCMEHSARIAFSEDGLASRPILNPPPSPGFYILTWVGMV